MLISKAIEILSDLAHGPEAGLALDEKDALELGKEALEHIVYLRKDMDRPHWMTLLGETKD